MQDTSLILIVEFFGFYGLITSDSDFFPWLKQIGFSGYLQYFLKFMVNS